MAALSKLSRYRKSEGGRQSQSGRKQREREREGGRVDFRSGRDPQIEAVQSKLIWAAGSVSLNSDNNSRSIGLG